MGRGENSPEDRKMGTFYGGKPFRAGPYLIGFKNPVFRLLEGFQFGQFKPFAR